MKGERADPARLRQNERYVVALTVTEPPSRYGRLLLVDPVPAGLEIENANLTEGASVAGLDWLKQEVSPVHTEARDDRYVAAFERSGDSNQKLVFTVGLYRPRRLARPLCRAGRRDRGHVPAGPLRADGLRHGRYRLGAVAHGRSWRRTSDEPRTTPSPPAGEGWGEGSRCPGSFAIRSGLKSRNRRATPHPSRLRRATFSRRGRREARRTVSES